MRKYRFFGALLSAQEKWLNKMSSSGYRLVRVEKLFYDFEVCTPGQYKYCVDFIGHMPKEKALSYSKFLEEFGYNVFFKSTNISYSVWKFRYRPWAEEGGRYATNLSTYNRELLIVEKENDGLPLLLHTTYCCCWKDHRCLDCNFTRKPTVSFFG